MLLVGWLCICLCRNGHSCPFTFVGVIVWLLLIREQSTMRTRSMLAFSSEQSPYTKHRAWPIAEVQRGLVEWIKLLHISVAKQEMTKAWIRAVPVTTGKKSFDWHFKNENPGLSLSSVTGGRRSVPGRLWSFHGRWRGEGQVLNQQEGGE